MRKIWSIHKFFERFGVLNYAFKFSTFLCIPFPICHFHDLKMVKLSFHLCREFPGSLLFMGVLWYPTPISLSSPALLTCLDRSSSLYSPYFGCFSFLSYSCCWDLNRTTCALQDIIRQRVKPLFSAIFHNGTAPEVVWWNIFDSPQAVERCWRYVTTYDTGTDLKADVCRRKHRTQIPKFAYSFECTFACP